ncbi:hypothetical protein JCM11641_006810 [Rhodosporidiobolus odoratus]
MQPVPGPPAPPAPPPPHLHRQTSNHNIHQPPLNYYQPQPHQQLQHNAQLPRPHPHPHPQPQQRGPPPPLPQPQPQRPPLPPGQQPNLQHHPPHTQQPMLQGGMGPPPPGMQRPVGIPPGQHVIGPSHPQHPQHGARLAQQHSQHAYLPPQPPQSGPSPARPGRSQPLAQPYPPQPGPQPPAPFPQASSPAPARGPPQLPPQPPQSLNAPSPAQLPPAVYHSSPHLQPAHVARPTPPQQATGLPPPVGPLPQPPQPRLAMSAVPSQQNPLLGAHLAIHGCVSPPSLPSALKTDRVSPLPSIRTGPITATAAPAGPALSRLAALNDAVIQASEDERPLEALRGVIAEHFTETGVVKVGLHDKGAQLSKVFEIPCSAWPRFQHLNLLLGVLSTSLSTTFAREYRLTMLEPTPARSPASPAHPGGPPPLPPAAHVHVGYLLQADDAVWSSRFSQGIKVDLVGTLTVHLLFKNLGSGTAGLRIESLEFESRGHEEWIVKEAMQAMPDVSSEARKRASLSGALGIGNGGDAKVEDQDRPRSKKGAAPPQKGMVTRRRSASARSEARTEEAEDEHSDDEERKVSADGLSSQEEKSSRSHAVRVPLTPVGTFGVTEMGMRCLEIAESVAQLQDLIAFSVESGIGPIQSLSRFADRYRASPTYSISQLPGGTPFPSHAPPPATPASSVQLPIAASHQNPSTNSFYSSVTASPSSGPGGLPRRPGTAGEGDAGSPASIGGKRKLSSSGLVGGYSNGDGFLDDPGSPQKMQRTAAGAARGRGRGR